jgi:RimJ/RimL family protein N-acetyltransferase
MESDFSIRRLRTEDAPALMVLRREALETEPLAFGSSPVDDRANSPGFVQAMLSDVQEQAVFGCFDASGRLIGMIGVVRASRIKERHKAQIWGMYLQARGKGLGRALLSAAIHHARTWPEIEQLHLCVTDAAVAARSLYESAGFRCWGCEPRALAWEGRFVDDFHLLMDLRQV